MILRLLCQCTGAQEPARVASSEVSEPVVHNDLRAAAAIISPFSPLFPLIPTVSAPSGRSDTFALIPLLFRLSSKPLVSFPAPRDSCFVLWTLSGAFRFVSCISLTFVSLSARH